jgi:hypothetical protein
VPSLGACPCNNLPPSPANTRKRCIRGFLAGPKAADIALKVIVDRSNPREYFDLAEMAELVASVQVKGVCTSIIIRLDEDGVVVLIAGERRNRVAMIAQGWRCPKKPLQRPGRLASVRVSFAPLTETTTVAFDASSGSTSSKMLTYLLESFRSEGAVRRRLTSMRSYILKTGLKVALYLRG